MSKQKIARVSVDATEKAVTWIFTDGTSQKRKVEEFPEEIRTQLMLHGLRQKGSDSYASAASKYHEAGYDNPVDWAKDELTAVMEAAVKGDWTRGGSLGGLVYKAIAEAMQQPLETVLAAFEAMETAQREAKLKQIRKHPQFKAVYAKMQAEAAEKKAESAGSLENLLS